MHTQRMYVGVIGTNKPAEFNPPRTSPEATEVWRRKGERLTYVAGKEQWIAM